MTFPGFVTPGALISGVDNLVSIFLASPTRQIGGIMMDITIEEEGTDELTITEHPVEQGAAISDHAYKEPARLRIRAMCSNSSLQAQGASNALTGFNAAAIVSLGNVT